MHLLSWVSKGLIPSRMDFGIQLWWAALGFLCWVLMWVPPRSLVLLGVVSLGTDGTHIFPILLLWLNGWFASHPSLTFPFKKVPYFSECTECYLTESLVLQGTVAALMMALTWHSLCFECLFSQLASSFLMMWWLIWLWSRQPEWTSPFDKLIVAAELGLLLSRSLSEVWHIFSGHFVWCVNGNVWRGEFPDLTRASHGRQDSDVDHCRGLPLSSIAVQLWHHDKRTGAFSHWWLKASASFWFMD